MGWRRNVSAMSLWQRCARRVADILDPGPSVQPGGLRPGGRLGSGAHRSCRPGNDPPATVLCRRQARRRAIDTPARRWQTRGWNLRRRALTGCCASNGPPDLHHRRSWERFPPSRRDSAGPKTRSSNRFTIVIRVFGVQQRVQRWFAPSDGLDQAGQKERTRHGRTPTPRSDPSGHRDRSHAVTR